jgi:hypothetical protein
MAIGLFGVAVCHVARFAYLVRIGHLPRVNPE